MRNSFVVGGVVAALLIGCSSDLDKTTARQRGNNDPVRMNEVPGVPEHDPLAEDPGEQEEPGTPDSGTKPEPSCIDKVLESKLPLSFHATTTGKGNDFGPTSCDKTSSGNDVSYVYKAPEAGRYYINTLNSAFMAQISVRTSCSGAVLGCSTAPKYGPFGTAMYIDLTKGQEIVIVIDGDTSVAGGDSGDFRLSISKVVGSEVVCDDSLDDDGDGKVDCADSDCVGKLPCIEDGGNCLDGVDNDLDGKIDCDDPDCQPSSDGTLESKVPVSVSSTTVGKSNDYVVYNGATCGMDGVNKTPDVGYTYVVPEDGFYRFSATTAAGAALTVQIYTPTCYSYARTCKPTDVPLGGLTMTKGEQVIFVVEANSESGEPFTLSITK